jgi:predicted dehydrogenase
MRIAIVGCGYVVEYYARTLPNYPELELVGVADRRQDRADKVSRALGVVAYDSLESLLADERVELVVNLTNPKSHFEVSKACLQAGKHVYSEKPLAVELERARELVALAENRGLGLAAAPCSVLGEAAQTVWRALRESELGNVVLVHAELNDGMVHRMAHSLWRNEFGMPWPSDDEFATGCTLEHAGYALSWLCAFFGPVRALTAYSTTLIRDQGTKRALLRAPDYSIACLELASGVVARLTNSFVAEPDRGFNVFGEHASLRVSTVWRYDSPILIRRNKKGVFEQPAPYPLVREAVWEHRYRTREGLSMDFARGVHELCSSLNEKRPCRIGARFSLHVNEVTLAIQNAGISGGRIPIESSFEPMSPMPWAVAGV